MVEGYNVHVCEHAHITYSDYAVEMSKCSECGAPIRRTWTITESDDVDAKEDAAEAFSQELLQTDTACLEYRITELSEEITELRKKHERQVAARMRDLENLYERMDKLTLGELAKSAETAKK